MILEKCEAKRYVPVRKLLYLRKVKLRCKFGGFSRNVMYWIPSITRKTLRFLRCVALLFVLVRLFSVYLGNCTPLLRGKLLIFAKKKTREKLAPIRRFAESTGCGARPTLLCSSKTLHSPADRVPGYWYTVNLCALSCVITVVRACVRAAFSRSFIPREREREFAHFVLMLHHLCTIVCTRGPACANVESLFLVHL